MRRRRLIIWLDCKRRTANRRLEAESAASCTGGADQWSAPPVPVLERNIVVERAELAMQIFPLFRRIVRQLLRRRDHVLQRSPRPLDHGDVERRRGILPRL